MSSIRTVYIRKADPSGKHKDIISSHQVWDIDRFMESQIEQNMGAKVKPDDIRVVSIADEADYRTYKGYKGYQS